MRRTLNDPNAAEAFYTQKLGFHPLRRFGAIVFIHRRETV
jgi:catechol 2,3-dioxygenase-like lactoylglutathione lyase family enzyme